MRNVAVITGASMGLGEEFARQLAARGLNLLLTARSADRLEALSRELRAAHDIEVLTLALDLAEPHAARRLFDFIRAQGVEPVWLINNAGFGDARPFESIPLERVLGTIQVNVAALVELTHLMLPLLRRQPAAHLLNVASTAAFQPVPYFAVYAASKAFVLGFTEALHEELLDSPVRVTALCPGPTATQFNKNNAVAERVMHKSQPAGLVVRLGIEGALAGHALVISQNRFMLFMQRLLPRVVVRKIAAWLLRTGLKNLSAR